MKLIELSALVWPPFKKASAANDIAGFFAAKATSTTAPATDPATDSAAGSAFDHLVGSDHTRNVMLQCTKNGIKRCMLPSNSSRR